MGHNGRSFQETQRKERKRETANSSRKKKGKEAIWRKCKTTTTKKIKR